MILVIMAHIYVSNLKWHKEQSFYQKNVSQVSTQRVRNLTKQTINFVNLLENHPDAKNIIA